MMLNLLLLLTLIPLLQVKPIIIVMIAHIIQAILLPTFSIALIFIISIKIPLIISTFKNQINSSLNCKNILDLYLNLVIKTIILHKRKEKLKNSKRHKNSSVLHANCNIKNLNTINSATTAIRFSMR